MSTDVYSRRKYNDEELKQLRKKQSINEVQWYMSEVVTTQLESIKETLQTCVKNLDEDNVITYKLPLSSHKSEILKGIVTRQNFKIIGLHLILNSKNFNNGKKFDLQLKQSEFLIIRQLLDCHDAMENAISNLEKIIENHKNNKDADLFVRYIEQVCSNVILARKSLSSPDPEYVFPLHRLPGGLFEPNFPNTAALDFLINDGELTVEFKSLVHVEQKPWNVIIDKENHLSFADVVRNQISKQRGIPLNKIIAEEYQKYLDWSEQHHDENQNELGISNTFKNIFASNSNPSFSTLIKNASAYLEQSITFTDDNNEPYVVQIKEKCEVVTSDPVLLSIRVKIESLEKTLHRIRDNLSSIYA